MQENQSVTPHDDYFKLLMEVKENVVEFIQATFPEPLVQKIDFESLENINTSFRNNQIGNFRADVVYSGSYKNGKHFKITFLFEHKSFKAKLPHLQLLKYMIGLWEREHKNRAHPCVILPVLFYHGKQKWHYQKFEEYFDGVGDDGIDPDLRPFIPEFEYIFVNLQEKGNAWIYQNIRRIGLRIGLLLMRNYSSPVLFEELTWIFEGMQELEKSEKGRHEIEEILLYLYQVREEPNEKIRQVMDHETFMSRPHPVGSTAWQITQEEKAISKAEGIAEAKTMLAKNLLREGFSNEKIVDLTGLAYQEVEKLRLDLA